jgi:hypothetical protein
VDHECGHIDRSSHDSRTLIPGALELMAPHGWVMLKTGLRLKAYALHAQPNPLSRVTRRETYGLQVNVVGHRACLVRSRDASRGGSRKAVKCLSGRTALEAAMMREAELREGLGTGVVPPSVEIQRRHTAS